MDRKITGKLFAWKNKEHHRPLLVLGCRQCGKTYSVTEFAKSYENHIYINFEKDPSKKAIFEGDLSTALLLEKIKLASDTEYVQGKTLLVFDEIQLSPGAMSSLKSFASDGITDIVAMGSFLGVVLGNENEDTAPDHESPVGFVDIERMYPMDFEEFCWAMGVNKDIIGMVTQALADQKEVDKYINHVLSDLFRRYIVVGGMPAAVEEYAKSKDYPSVRRIQENILLILKNDAGRYSDRADKDRIIDCMDSIPIQLASDKRSFEYGSILKSKQGYGKREYGSALHWLETAGISIRSYNMTTPSAPVDAYTKADSFRVFLNDTGLLVSMMDATTASEVVNHDPYANNGALMENTIASALVKKGYRLRYYSKSDSTLEIDFVLNTGENITLLEVKSGRKKRSKSLSTLLSSQTNRKGIKAAESNVSVDEKGILHLPLYGICFLPDAPIPEFDSVDVEELNRRYEGMRNRNPPVLRRKRLLVDLSGKVLWCRSVSEML